MNNKTNTINKKKKLTKNKLTFDSRIDYALILPAFLLTVIGLYAIWVAVSHDYPTQATQMVGQQGTWIIVGVILALIVMHMDSRLLWNLTPVLYGLGLILMVLPLFFYSPSMYALTGSKNWVAFHNTNLFQPSEMMKIAYILFLSKIVVSFQNKLKKRYLKDDFILIGQIGLATVPIAVLAGLQKDFGTFMVFLVIASGIILVSGVSWKIILPVILAAILVGVGIVAMVMDPKGQELLGHVFSQYQINRFLAWLHPFEYTQTFSLQQSRALIAIGVGGLFGRGFGVANINVPVRESDMIFTVIGEGFGFVGATFVILLYFILIYRMIRVTFQSNNQFYTFISTGIIMMILFHVFENIGAAIGLVPLTGIPLPFISQGGSALISNIIGLGLVLSMKYNQLPEFITVREAGRKSLENKKARLSRSSQKRVKATKNRRTTR
ncbi:FtsW/RodA/SpoVE family cell cycle protein [Lactococcus garvieae]|uniref:Cell division protein FtsW n=1 Tax=Lactococcus garvieae DCC43 TaxID=1231377 RepID=K2NVA3_9LACT|nr:FtsW/RodA/SpoVE family cell cycle protein [Lactococcus garvieae]EKF51448.1 Cell division protein FtsW [Lactococcus garvieae DCC43]QPS71442.1 FtsW/RodA/SpoVE family cell cycle protein [Lactococcus garvieae]